MEQKKEDTLDTLLNKLCDQLDESICSDGKSNVVSKVKNCIAECFGILGLGQRVGVTWKWPITACFIYWGLCFYCSRGLLDARLNNYAELLRKKIPLEWSVMLIFDNINIYKGHSRHIKKSTAPSMWNFTNNNKCCKKAVSVEKTHWSFSVLNVSRMSRRT